VYGCRNPVRVEMLTRPLIYKVPMKSTCLAALAGNIAY
jgi:hypothetical protein